MDQIIITHRNGTTLKLNSKENISAIKKATQQVELLGVDVVDISVESAKKMIFFIGDKITIIGRDYTLNTPAKERKISENHFQYDMQFEGVQYDLLRATFNVNIDTTSNQIQDINGDDITGDIKMFLDVLIANANRVFGTGKWVLGTYPSSTKTLTLTFSDSDNCLTVLQTLCGEDNFNTEFKIDIDESGIRTLNIGSLGNSFPYAIQYGKGKGIYELTREKVSSSNIITRLNCFGGSKNIITPKYRASKLCLPTKSKSQSFIENTSAISTYGVWEATKNFDDIYPHRKGTISSLGATVFEFIDSSMNFDLNEKNVDGSTKYLMAGTSAKIKFNTGNLAGYEFEINKYENSSKKFTITSQQDQNDYIFPSTTTAAFQFAIGDEYVITDIYMPQSYIDTAEAELATKGAAYLAKYSQPLVQYGLTLDSNFLKNLAGLDLNIIWVGDYIEIKDTDLDVNKSIRVKGFTRDLMLDYSYQLTIADLAITVSTITRVISGMDTIDKVIKINNLNDPARARRNWKDSQEVLNMVFDTEGDFYTDKIKPLSIETSMLSVGAKSMQFGLEGTIFEPNYLGLKNRVVYVGGILSHYAILDTNNDPAYWNIGNGDVTINSDTARYVYAKCSRSSTSASILFSETQITVDSDGAYYHFLIGILNSVDVNNTRALALMYGFTTVNGRFIKTGRIQSADGNTYFDLDTNEIGGKIFFKDGLVSGLIGVGPDSGTINAGMNGQGTLDTDIRFWAGAVAANKETAPFRVQQNGKVYMSDAEIAGKVTADSGAIGDWRIIGGGIINDTTDAYIIGRQSGISGYSEARIGSSVLSAVTGYVIPAYFKNTIENQFQDNIALIVEAKHGSENKAIVATGDIVITAGDAISSKLNYINLYSGAVNVIYIRNGLKIHSRNVSGATRALYLPSLTDIRDYLWISTFSVTSAAAVSSTTATVYYVAKGNGLFVGDAIKYSTSAYQTIVDIIRYESSTYDKITVETTLGIAVANGGTFTAIHEFSVEINIAQDSIAVQNQIDVYPNGATFYDNNGGTFTSVPMGRGDIMKVLCFTRKNIMYYQLVHYKNA